MRSVIPLRPLRWHHAARMKTALVSLSMLFVLSLPCRASSYLRVGMGGDSSTPTTVHDRDCAAVQPPALFGCVSGNDGRPIAARGDFGRSGVVEVAVGREIGRRLRAELAMTSRPNLGLDAETNFTGVEGAQPATADVRSHAALFFVAFDLASRDHRVVPFIVAGAGAVRNELGPVRYAFPSIARSAVTLTWGGTWTGLAWSAGAGAAIRLAESLALEVAVRRNGLGEVRSEDGPATIVRPRGTFVLDIAGTRAGLETTSVTISLRHRM